jgi:hypothetical protein
LLDKEAKTKYSNVLMDKFLREDYLNVIRYFTKPEILKEKVSKLNKRNVEYKTIYSNHNKIMLIHDLETELKINKLDVMKLPIDKEYKISEELTKKINTAFRCEIIPKTFNECIEYYVNKLKSIFGSTNLIQGTKKQVNKIRSVHFSINTEAVQYYFELHYLSSPYRETIDTFLLNKYKEEIKVKEDDVFIDDDECEEESNKLEVVDTRSKNYWKCRFCNFKDFEESNKFYNDMQCFICMKKGQFMTYLM